MNLSTQNQARGQESAFATSSGSWNTDPISVPPNIQEDLQGLAAKGLTAPLGRKTHPKQGEQEANVHLLQTVWCRYAGQCISQPTNIWSAVLSKLAATQVQEQQHQQDRQRHVQTHHLPSYTTQTNSQDPSHLSWKSLSQDQPCSSTPVSDVDCIFAPAGVGSVWSQAASLQDSQALHENAQQELAELLKVTGVHGTSAYHADPAAHCGSQQQLLATWPQPNTHTDAHALQHRHGVTSDHGHSEPSLLLSPCAELSQIMSWSQLDPPHKDQKLQQQQQAQLRSNPSGSTPFSSLSQAYSESWWAQHSSQTAPYLGSLPSDSHLDMPPRPESMASHPSHSTTLGMGQFALEAAGGPSYQAAAQQQPEPSQWLQALENARAVRPRHMHQPDPAHSSGAFNGSASPPGNREDSGDLSTSLGTQSFLGRACSIGPGINRVRDPLRPVGMPSPKSSLGSSLPSFPHSLVQLSQSSNGRATLAPPPSKPLGGQGAQLGAPCPDKLLMQLVAAPSTFSVPLCTGKLLNPPFRVRVAMLSEVPTELPLTLKAYVLSKDSLNSLEQWHPAEHIVTEAVSGGEVQQTVACSEGAAAGEAPGAGGRGAGHGEAAGLFGGVADFVFRDLKFTTSSRMKPRWLVIAAVLPTQDVMYVQYNVPTIVMSRACDQLTKAMGILKGVQQGVVIGAGPGVAPAPKKRHRNGHSPALPTSVKPEEFSGHASPTLHSSCMPDGDRGVDTMDWPPSAPYTLHRWHVLVERKYNAFNLGRSLGLDDLHMLECVAGFHEEGQNKNTACELTPQKWVYFGVWYLSYLRIFRSHQQLWIMQSPVVICGFGTDRQRAENLLTDQPVGTFLVRPALSLAGCMIISAVIPGGHCKHMALNSTQLDSRSLEVWVGDILEAQQLLDCQTGQRFSKSKVFALHHQRFGVVSDVTSHPSSQGGSTGGPHQLPTSYMGMPK